MVTLIARDLLVAKPKKKEKKMQIRLSNSQTLNFKAFLQFGNESVLLSALLLLC